jgi:general secretion pathway protein G
MRKKRLPVLKPYLKCLKTARASKHFSAIAKTKIFPRGFTLLELLFALMIIGILAAIAIPVYNSHRDKIAVNTAINDIIQIQNAIERYYTENFNYPASLNVLSRSLPNGGDDPWGRPYVYTNIINGGPGIKSQVRHDRNLSPINSLYDLYSKGKDGLFHKQLNKPESLDDVVLARDGAFIGLAADF